MSTVDRPELVGFCYRMLGSVFEAEDAVQETMLRAWRGASTFEGRSSERTWVYRIATNVCADMLRARGRAAVPMDLGPSSPVAAFHDLPQPDRPWLTPVPTDPGDAAAARETVRLAFVAALQHLPPRQRAVLILRDVLAWSAAEVAALLDTSTGAVNALLNRARTTLSDRPAGSPGEVDHRLLARYVDAFQRYDIDTLVTLLHTDAVQSMPPYAAWFQGATEIGRFMLGPGAECRGSSLIPVRANGVAAFGQYRADGNPWSLQVLEIREGRIAELHHFLQPGLFEVFGLPPVHFPAALSSASL